MCSQRTQENISSEFIFKVQDGKFMQVFVLEGLMKRCGVSFLGSLQNLSEVHTKLIIQMFCAWNAENLDAGNKTDLNNIWIWTDWKLKIEKECEDFYTWNIERWGRVMK